MTGYVYFGHAIIEVSFQRQGVNAPVEFVIDTGFTWYLTLPLSDVAVLGLPYEGEMEVDLADESSTKVGVYTGAILWHGQRREVPVIATGERPLLGLALLKDNDLYVNFTENGVVTITPQALTAP